MDIYLHTYYLFIYSPTRDHPGTAGTRPGPDQASPKLDLPVTLCPALPPVTVTASSASPADRAVTPGGRLGK